MQLFKTIVEAVSGEIKKVKELKEEKEKLQHQVAQLENKKPVIVQQNVTIMNTQNTINAQQTNVANVVLQRPSKTASSSLLKNKTFALCGTFSILQQDLEATIIRNGGHIGKSVDKDTDYVLIGNDVATLPDTSKAKAARGHNVTVLREQYILDVNAKQQSLSVTSKYKFTSSSSSSKPKANKAPPAKKSVSVSGHKRKLQAIEPPAKKAKTDSILKSKNFVLCGTLSVNQSEMKQRILENGGHVVSKIDKDADYVIVGNNAKSLPATKSAEAKALGKPLVREQFVFDCIQEKKLKNVTKKYRYDP